MNVRSGHARHALAERPWEDHETNKTICSIAAVLQSRCVAVWWEAVHLAGVEPVIVLLFWVFEGR